MSDINIASGGGGGRKYVIFTGLLPFCPKSSDQGCRLQTSIVYDILGSFRLDYEYEIEYEYDFRISNQ